MIFLHSRKLDLGYLKHLHISAQTSLAEYLVNPPPLMGFCHGLWAWLLIRALSAITFSASLYWEQRAMTIT